ncbi:hypothetical protein N7467_008962 [Penicillium canescens]|nr:hypothetical protein N7467_008962 [Penicillium canescens]
MKHVVQLGAVSRQISAALNEHWGYANITTSGKAQRRHSPTIFSVHVCTSLEQEFCNLGFAISKLPLVAA